MSGIADKDRARVQAFQLAGHLGKRDGSLTIANTDITYTAQVGFGEPAEYYTLLIDTGSANTWVGANKPYTPTATSINIGNPISASYTSGNFSGEEWVDTVTLAPGLVIKNQSIGVTTTSVGTNLNSLINGILGVGPVNLTVGSLESNAKVPTVMDNLYAQHTISEQVLGVYFVPASESISNGTLTFGCYDPLVITGPMNYVPLTTSYPASMFWGIDQSISYDCNTILSTTAGIVDTGTSLILVATDAFNAYTNMTGGVPDEATGLLSITPDQYNKLKTLSFQIGPTTHDLTPNAWIWPRSLNTQIGGNSSAIYLIISDIGPLSGQGIDFVNGFSFLERFYSVYDTTNRRVGFAATAYTTSTLD